MNDDPTLEAFRLADSFLPVGTDSLSYGLEQFVQADRVESADDLRALLETHLRRRLGPGDLVALRVAHRAATEGDLERVCTADRRLEATTVPAEFRESAQFAGDRLLSIQRSLRDDDFLAAYADRVEADDAPGLHPVALGVVTARADVPAREACLVCCHEFATALLGAGQRLLSLGATDAQAVLDALRPVMVDAIDESAHRKLDELRSFAPLIDVLAAQHERADRRLFVS